MSNTEKKSITRVQLIVVIVVAVILAAILTALFVNVLNKANESNRKLEENQSNLSQLLEEALSKLGGEGISREEMEAILSEKLAGINAGVPVDSAAILAAVEAALKEYDVATAGAEGITEEQMEAIISNILAGSLTESEVVAIVQRYAGNSLSAAQMRSVVEAAVANSLTATQIANIVTQVIADGDTPLSEIIADLDEISEKSLTEEQIKEIIEEIFGTIFGKPGPGGDEDPEPGPGEDDTPTVPKSLKILAIGNSFSVDAMEYLWNICNAAGIEEIVLGNLYIGGCSLDTHWGNMQKNANAYTYYSNTSGYWKSENSKSVLYGLEQEDWDIITIQQVSQDSGVASTYTNLQNIIDYINKNKTNENAKIYWHMTWAYQANSTHSGFANYGKDQDTMYKAIVETVNSVILNNKDIAGVIPSGTAVQNLRTSYLGDKLTRDGYHMTYDNGRYTVALTWFKTLTGLGIDEIDWVPASNRGISANLAAIREAVNATVEAPYAVTKVAATASDPIGNVTTELTEADREIIKAAGYDPDIYVSLNWNPTMYAYYNSSTGSTITTVTGSTATNFSYFIASSIFTRAELPTGTLIVVDKGYQYRPEGWVALGQGIARNDNVEAKDGVNVTMVNSAWWGTYNYRAFNVAYIGGKTVMSEEDIAHFHIYLPTEEVKEEEPETPGEEETSADAELFKKNGLDITEYVLLNWNPVLHSYYNSTDASLKTASTRSTGTTNIHKQFISSSIYTKEQLPNGTVIIADEGYKYRPEGWVELSQRNSKRPDEVKATNFDVVDDEWWGDFNYCAFNFAFDPATTITIDEAVHLRIYVPAPDKDADAKLFAEKGLDIANYDVFDWSPVYNTYYNSNSDNLSDRYTAERNPTAANLAQFVSSSIYTKEDLPVGTVIIVDAGYRYRPEGWVALDQKNDGKDGRENRPGNVTENFYVVNETWWGNFNYRAFNLSYFVDGTTVIDGDAVHLRIYVPKA